MQSAAQKFLDYEIEYDELYGAQQNEQPQLTVTRRSSVLAGVARLRLLLCVAMLVVVVSLVIVNNVAIVELGDRLNSQTRALEQLRSEGERLTAKLDNSISLSEVAELASSNMLMGKEGSYQITYISLGDGDVVSRTTKTPDQMPVQKVMSTIGKLKEYMQNR